jgi:uncharacterized protein YjbJ (UPF0337 family)
MDERASGRSRAISTNLERHSMNKDQVKGAVKEATGKVQEKFGDLIGSNEQRAKGLVKEVAGKAERKLGDAEEVLKNASPRKP